MNKDELEYKHNVVALLTGLGWGLQAHEDMISNFIPDLSFGFARVDGWIEIKYLNKIPKSLGKIPHYTYGQQDWLATRGAKGSGQCYLWIGTPDGHFIWHWTALSAVRDLPWAEAIDQSLCYSDLGDLCRAISAVVRRQASYSHSHPNVVRPR